jgi:hypothetical protein
MTDKPNTLSLNARQWRVLLNDRLEVLKAVVASGEFLNDATLKDVFEHLDQARLMTVAWRQNSPQEVAEAAEPQAQGEQAPAPQANGAVPKRKGGWPAGKPRKRKMPAQEFQS